MNPAHGAHMGQKAHDVPAKEAGDVHASSGQHHMPSIHIHSHAQGHTVHIMHPDGKHEKFEHEAGDSDGMAEHLHNHLSLNAGNNEGQGHGVKDGMAMEDEEGYGPGV